MVEKDRSMLGRKTLLLPSLSPCGAKRVPEGPGEV
jgi:hypothetical protein